MTPRHSLPNRLFLHFLVEKPFLWFHLTSKTGALLFQSIGVFSVATGYSIQLFLSPNLFLSFPCISPNKIRSMLAAISSLHFCSYILEGFSSPQSCHSLPAQNHPPVERTKPFPGILGFLEQKILYRFFFSPTEK